MIDEQPVAEEQADDVSEKDPASRLALSRQDLRPIEREQARLHRRGCRCPDCAAG